MKRTFVCLAVLVFCVSLPAFAADPPVPLFQGSYNITAYEEPSLGSFYTWCFVFTNTGGVLGYSNSGTWTVPSYSLGWSGTYYVTGDEVIIHGVADGTFIFSYKGRILSGSKISGRQVEFFIDGSTDTAGTFLGSKVSACPAAVSTQRDPAK